MRLYEAWLEWSPRGESGAAVRAGLYDLNSEFDASDVRATFTNSAFGIGQDIAQTGSAGPSIYPDTALALRIAMPLAERWRIQAVALDAAPGTADDSAATAVRLRDGALVVAEVQRAGTRARKLALAAWAYTRATEPLAPAPARARRNHGAYASLDVGLAADADAAGAVDRGASAFLRIGFADARSNEYDLFAATGIVHRFDAGERERAIGLGLAYARASSAYRTALRDAGATPARGETVLELTLRVAVTHWLTLQPHVQYVSAPSARGSTADALVAGLRFALGPRTFHPFTRARQ